MFLLIYHGHMHMYSICTHEVVFSPHKPHGSDCLFRVSLKAVIINGNGEILLVKENGRDRWDIPGGGIEHGESIKEGLARELMEELGYQGDFQYELLEITDPQVLESRTITQILVIMLVRLEGVVHGSGDDADEVAYMNPQAFESSSSRTEQEIYQYSQLAHRRLRLP